MKLDVQLPHSKLIGDLQINSGEVQVWQGANGIGKSSLMKYLRDNNRLESFSYCMQRPLNVLGDFTARMLLYDLKDYLGEENINDVNYLIKDFNLVHKLDRPIRTLSGGENQALKLISCFMIRASGYFLDEATTHLDQDKINALMSCLKQLKEASKKIVMIEHHPCIQEVADKTLHFIKKENVVEVSYGN
jgi:ABC-type multidrug transport system ATPase subunit